MPIPTRVSCAVSITLALFVGAGCADSSQNGSDPPTPLAEAVDLGAAAGSLLDEPETADAAQQENPNNDSREKQFPGISFVIPENWIEQTLSAALSVVINSKYTIPHSKGNMELTMTTMGGGAEENIQRWVGQIQLGPGETPKYESIDINGAESSWVDVRGTYTSRVDQRKGPFENWRLVGVVIPNQPKDFILKLIGPREAIAGVFDEFKRFVKTAKFDR